MLPKVGTFNSILTFADIGTLLGTSGEYKSKFLKSIEKKSLFLKSLQLRQGRSQELHPIAMQGDIKGGLWHRSKPSIMEPQRTSDEDESYLKPSSGFPLVLKVQQLIIAYKTAV